ncbi:MAG: glycosyltransferase [Candidatus Sumerlaeaceae bacterium]|nr:glycosyltransferase [Candidatus Sumerlaeaceae bacterium]
MSPPAISVVIPFYNRRDEVCRCVESVLAQTLPNGQTFEVIAVDNGSTDNSAAALSKYGIRVEPCSRRGPAAARNAGVARAGASIVAMIDSDCVADPGWLAALIAPFSHPDVLCTGGHIEGFDHTRGVAFFAHVAGILDQEKLFNGVFCFPPFFATANAAFRREAFLRAGGFDEELLVGEDADLIWRVLDLGGRMALCKTASVRHKFRNTFDGFWRQALEYGEGAATIFARHHHRMGRRVCIEWGNLLMLAILPAIIVAKLFATGHPFHRKSRIYDLIWRTGFTFGRLKGSLRHRVLFF